MHYSFILGDRCELNIDECLDNPCVVNNTVECIDGIGGLNNYTCDCKPGYNCESSVRIMDLLS